MGQIEVLKKHFEVQDNISNIEAQAVYKIRALPRRIADLKNIGSRWGGACTAAAFLGQFVEDKKWAHLDIAGVGMNNEYKHLGCVGSAGFGVRLFVSFLLNAAKNK